MAFMDALLRDITAINDFQVGVDACTLLIPEMPEKRKRVAFNMIEVA